LPELPDVEGYRRVLAHDAKGRPIEGVEVLDRTLLRNASPQALGRALHGERFREPVRHGKWLLAPAGDVTVLMHFGMTGLLEWSERGARHVHDRIVFRCRGGDLRYRNMRKFGGVWLARDERERESITGALGPDAEKLDRDQFEELIAHRRGGAKAALLDQRFIAGLGNLMVDEVLWRARVNPREDVRALGRRRLDHVYGAMRDVEQLPSRSRPDACPASRAGLQRCAIGPERSAHGAGHACGRQPWPGGPHAGARGASERVVDACAPYDFTVTPPLAAIVSVDPFTNVHTPGRNAAFIVLVAFLISFLAIRTSARLTRSVSWWPGGVVTESGTHVHHLVWGICLMLGSGFLAFAAQADPPWWHLMAIIFGIGAGLTMDEFALWVHLEDVYWSEEGRSSFDAVVLAAAFAGLVVIGTEPFGLDDPGSIGMTAAVVLIALAVAVTCFLKGKLLLGVLSLFVPLVGIPAAVRLARPSSPWARWFYSGRRSARLERARQRFDPDRRDARLARRLSDLVAGAPSRTRTAVAEDGSAGSNPES
jgi:DNA-formamidopyrimidine glycosylase